MSPSARTSTAPSLLQVCLATIHTVAIDAVQLLGSIDFGISFKPRPTGLGCGFVFVVTASENSTHLPLAAPTCLVRRDTASVFGSTRWLSTKVPTPPFQHVMTQLFPE